MVKEVVGIALIVIAVIFIISIFPFTFIGAGERGVVFNNTSGVENEVLDEGMHFKVPFIQSVRTVSVRVQKDEAEAMAGTNDLQTVTIKTVVNWRLNPERVNVVYQNVGDEEAVLNSIIRPRVAEIVKAESAKYSAEEMLTRRSDLKAGIDARLRDDLAKYNVILDDITLNDIDFSDQFNQAIERKATAEQEALAEKNKLESVKYQSEQKVLQAKAEAEAIRIKADAIAQNQELVKLNAVEKWDGKLPQYMMGDTVPFLNLK